MLLLWGAFYALGRSDPGVLFVAMVKGHRMAFWTLENRFTTKENPRDVILVVTSHQTSVRARVSSCPPGLAGCVPGGVPFNLSVPPSGEVDLRFPLSAQPTTIEVQRQALHPLYLAFLLGLVAALLLLFDGEARVIAVAVALTGGMYFSQTLGESRGLDVGGHLSHVQKIAQDGLFVNANACWECFHPPLYYWISSALLGVPGMLHPSDATILQGLALLLHCLCVPLAVAALRPLARGRWELLLYSGLVCLWPAAVLASARLGNDGLLNVFAFLVLLFLVREQFLAAAFAATTALLVKESAVVLVALVGCMTLLSTRRWRLPCLVLLGGLISAWGVRLVKHYDPARMEALASGMRVTNTFSNVALFDPWAFVMQAFVNPWNAETNRDHLQNYFWKTSLFGEWSYQFPLSARLAGLLSLGLLTLLVVAASAWWRDGRARLPALSLFLAFAAVTSYRLLHNFACNPDFRFVYPLVALPLALILARAQAWRAVAARWVTLGFLGLSQVILVLHWWFEA
ncbi:MAG: hypothetical protein ACXVB9_10055 [Bdellovibrionota bacterium]